MSMRSDLKNLKGVRYAKCHHENLEARTTDPVVKERLARIAAKFRKQEEDLSVQFTRTYSKDIEHMLNRERDLRRIIKELTPQ